MSEGLFYVLHFFPRAVKDWNALPEEGVSCRSLECFSEFIDAWGM